MPQLGKLDIHLKCPEYKTNATITVNKQSRNGEDVPVGIHFENSTGDFQNDYRFMNSEIINEKLKTVKFRGVNWDVEFEPSMAATQKLNFQAAANAEETTFVAQTDGTDLKFTFGDHSTHAGQFVFQPDVKGTLDKNWAWPVAQVLQILTFCFFLVERFFFFDGLTSSQSDGIVSDSSSEEGLNAFPSKFFLHIL